MSVSVWFVQEGLVNLIMVLRNFDSFSTVTSVVSVWVCGLPSAGQFVVGHRVLNSALVFVAHDGRCAPSFGFECSRLHGVVWSQMFVVGYDTTRTCTSASNMCVADDVGLTASRLSRVAAAAWLTRVNVSAQDGGASSTMLNAPSWICMCCP